MRRESALFFSHMLAAANLIEEFAQGRSLDDFSSNAMLRSAIYYQFAIIGEALSQLQDVDPTAADRVTNGKKIVGFRNQIVHGYVAIRDIVTWKIIQDHLPVLKNELAALLGEA